MDVLSDVLNWLRVEGTVSRRSEFSAPWGIKHAPNIAFSFFTVEKGNCFLIPEGRDPLALGSGDVVMLAPGEKTSMVDELTTRTVPYARVLEECTVLDEDKYALHRDRYPTIKYGGGGRETAIRGWGLRFDSVEHHPLLSLLPSLIHISYEQRCALPWLDTTLRFISHETQNQEVGSELMSTRLVDLLFVQVIRAWIQEQPDGQAGWLGALRDPSISHALRLVHQFPADPWTVESLGKTVGMSRSSFSPRFQSLVGQPPMKYVTQVRMHLAANALKNDPGMNLSQLASQVGYETEPSLGRAFKRYFGVSPGAFRRDAREAAP